MTIDQASLARRSRKWEWGFELDAEGRRKVVSKQDDVLWMGVSGNLGQIDSLVRGGGWAELGRHTEGD